MLSLSSLFLSLVASLEKIIHVAGSFGEVIIDLLVYKRIIDSVFCPRATAGDAREFHEAPVHGGFVGNTQVVAHGGGNIDPGGLVAFVFRALIAEDVFPVISDERAAIFPLGVADFLSPRAVDLDPSSFAD